MRHLRHLASARAVASVAALAILIVGVRFGTFVAADTDPYGYVSQAELIATGTLRLDQTFARSMPWPNPEWTFLPTAYTIAPDRRFAVPIYSSGLPLLMGAAQRITDHRDAVFYIVPLLGALAVWMTYRLGRSLDLPATGAIASLLLAASPIFLNQVVQPVSDVAAAAWWTACLALAVRGTAAASVGAGLAASMAILTRPNLVPLGIVIGAFLVWCAVRAESDTRRDAVRRALLFALASIPGCLAVAALNHHLHGAALTSGYGEAQRLFAWGHVLPNLDRYPRWLAESQTPFIYLGLLAPLFARVAQQPQVACLLAFSLTTLAMTMFFLPFGREDWGYLRFLLPAYPALLVLSVMVARQLLSLQVRRRAVFRTLTAAGVIALCAWYVTLAERRGAFVLRVAEQRYLQVGRFIATGLPDNAVFISGLHSGSIRYYADNLTVNFMHVSRRWLDVVIQGLADRGYTPYIALEDGERLGFTERFGEYTKHGRLDWPPRHRTVDGVIVNIWDPSDRARFLAGEPVVTAEIAAAR